MPKPFPLLICVALYTFTGCARPPTPRTVLDIVSDECVVLRKNTDRAEVEKACATAEELDPWIRQLSAARTAAAKRRSP